MNPDPLEASFKALNFLFKCMFLSKVGFRCSQGNYRQLPITHSDWLKAKLSTNALIGRERNPPLLVKPCCDVTKIPAN